VVLSNWTFSLRAARLILLDNPHSTFGQNPLQSGQMKLAQVQHVRLPGRCPLAPLRGGYGRSDHRSGLLRKPSMRDGDQNQGPGVPCSYHRYRSAARFSGEPGLTARARPKARPGE
jgi:hypothetical protein